MIQNDYQREYYEKNKAKVRAKQKEYADKNKGKIYKKKRDKYVGVMDGEPLSKGFIRITKWLPRIHYDWLKGEGKNHQKATIRKKRIITTLKDNITQEVVNVQRWGYALFVYNEN